MTGIDIGDQVAALLHAIADRHDTGGCGCTDPGQATDPVCVAADTLATPLLGQAQ